MVQVQVVNVRSSNAEVVYIGRPGRGRAGSPLGNPYVLKDESHRDAVVEQYRRWLWQQVRSREVLRGASWWRWPGGYRRGAHPVGVLVRPTPVPRQCGCCLLGVDGQDWDRTLIPTH